MNIEIKNELIESQSILSQLDKKYFVPANEVPTDYFDKMEDRFFAKLNEENAPKATKTISIWEKTNFQYAVAAVSIFALVGISLFSILRSDNKMNSLSQNEVVNYLQDEGELSTDMPSIQKIESVNIDDLTKEEIKNYLIENEDIDVNNIN